jgi:hypothetical protein
MLAKQKLTVELHSWYQELLLYFAADQFLAL